jgi:5-methylcytosine-specific restriction endonuclease McrA
MSLSKKAVRLKFREAVFKRDGHKCLFCNATENLEAHHIINRNLMPDGGYVVKNGATLCPFDHIRAENGSLTVERIQRKISKRKSPIGLTYNVNRVLLKQ